MVECRVSKFNLRNGSGSRSGEHHKEEEGPNFARTQDNSNVFSQLVDRHQPHETVRGLNSRFVSIFCIAD
jgi:hypothetical protein